MVQTVGVGQVLDHVKRPEEASLPHVVEFRGVTKTYNPGGAERIHGDPGRHVRRPGPDRQGRVHRHPGPSGCGKSTILRLIAGLRPQHPPTSGEVLVFGRPVERPGPDRGMVFQDYTSFDHRNVLDNVAFGLECQGVPRKIRYELARKWIAHVGLNVDKDQYKYPHELSGGMRQRVAIAQTLILRPRIILMDEPFGALDPKTRMNMQDLLLDLWRQTQATVFFVTHSIEEAVFLSDRVYVVSNSPGTILRELKIEPSDRPSKEMQRQPRFQDTVYYLRDLISQLEESQRGHGTGYRGQASEKDTDCRGPGKIPQEGVPQSLESPGLPGRLGFALLSGHPDVYIPLVLAGEAAYIGVVGTHPKFQRYVDSIEAKEDRARARCSPPRRSSGSSSRCRRVSSAAWKPCASDAPRSGRSPSRCGPRKS